MTCIRCKNENILQVSAKPSDLCTVICKSTGYERGPDYVPGGLGIGGGDYIEFDMCLNCGQVQDTFPKEPPNAEAEE